MKPWAQLRLLKSPYPHPQMSRQLLWLQTKVRRRRFCAKEVVSESYQQWLVRNNNSVRMTTPSTSFCHPTSYQSQTQRNSAPGQLERSRQHRLNRPSPWNTWVLFAHARKSRNCRKTITPNQAIPQIYNVLTLIWELYYWIIRDRRCITAK